MAVIGGSAGML